MIFKDISDKVLGVEKVHEGDCNSVRTSAHEIFKRTLMHNSARIVLAHNHPGTSPFPSSKDIALSWALARAGKQLDIEVSNHLILSSDGTFFPLWEAFIHEKYDILQSDGTDFEKLLGMFKADGFPTVPIPSKWVFEQERERKKRRGFRPELWPLDADCIAGEMDWDE